MTSRVDTQVTLRAPFVSNGALADNDRERAAALTLILRADKLASGQRLLYKFEIISLSMYVLAFTPSNTFSGVLSKTQMFKSCAMGNYFKT